MDSPVKWTPEELHVVVKEVFRDTWEFLKAAPLDPGFRV